MESVTRGYVNTIWCCVNTTVCCANTRVLLEHHGVAGALTKFDTLVLPEYCKHFFARPEIACVCAMDLRALY